MSKISKIIHQIRIEDNNFNSPELFLSISQSWKKNHPLWEYKQWGLQDIKILIQTSYPNTINFNNINDNLLLEIARYFIIYSEGGLFIDLDFECIEPFDNLIENKRCCLSYQSKCGVDNIISSSFVAATKEHSFIKFIIDRLEYNLNCIKEDKNLFLDKSFSLYENKNEIVIIPSSIVNPCSPAEIELYLKGLISKEMMEDIISESISICYHQNSKKKKIEEIDVLYLSSIVGHGGAFRAAHRIHQGLRTIGINSKLLTLNSNLGDIRNLSDNIHVAIPEAQEKVGYHNDLKPLEKYPQYKLSSHSFTPGIAGTDINKYIRYFNPKIVQIHWINAGYVTIEDLGKIKNKIVWRLADCWPLTGGCYYFGDCQRYMIGCGKCPKLGSEDDNDLSRKIWERKEKAWGKMDMTIVVPTQWMKQIVDSSTLLKGKKTFVIPNGLDLNEFYPIDKNIARKILNIPLDKKVILYGATNAINDPRKGFSLLLKALQLLSKKEENGYYFVIFGAEYQELNLNIPVRFMGYITEHSILQTLYSAADIMIVPSLEEAFGQTVTEAMACMTPVVSFFKTGPADIIEHKKTGYLVEYGNSLGLKKAIEWFFKDASRLNILSSNARYKIETTYDIKMVAKQYQNLYKQITEGSIFQKR